MLSMSKNAQMSIFLIHEIFYLHVSVFEHVKCLFFIASLSPR